jgi:hypothetical protein
MATIAFRAAAAGLGPVGLFVATVAGAMVDSYIAASLTAPPDQHGPRIMGQKVSTTDEGEPIPRAYGTEVRVQCHLIDHSEFIETENSTSNNGKGGRGGEYIEYTYQKHLLYSIARGPLLRVKKLLAGSRIIYNEDPDLNVTSDELVGETWQVGYNWWGSGQTGIYLWTYYLKIKSPADGPDLSIAKVGKNITLQNSGAGNNGVYKVIDSKTEADGSTYFTVSRKETIVADPGPFTPFVAGGAIPTIFQHLSKWDNKLMASAPAFITSPTDGRMGMHDQPVSTLFESIRNGAVPAYRHLAVFALDTMVLTDFGNIPPSITAVCVVDANATVGKTISAICQEHGMSADEIDVSALDDMPLSGLQSRGAQTAKSKLMPLMLGKELLDFEEAGVLHFIQRKNAEIIDIPASEIGVRMEGAQGPKNIKVKESPYEPPYSVEVHFTDTERDHQVGMQRGFRQGTSSSRIVPMHLLDLNMSPQEAVDLGLHQTWLADFAGRGVEWFLPPTQLHRVRAGKVARFTALGREWTILIGQMERTLESMLVCSGTVEQKHIFDLTSTPVGEGDSIQTTLGSGTQHRSLGGIPVDFHLIESVAFRDDHQFIPGHYIAASLSSPNEKFSGLVVYESVDELRETWRRVLDIRTATVMGFASTQLASAPVGLWDNLNEVTIELTNEGEGLERCSEDDCLNGTNRILIRDEIIGFTTPVQVADRKYTLKGLLRGLRGTGWAASEHVAGDRVVLLDGPGITFRPMNVASIGMSRAIKIVSPGTVIDEADLTEFRLQANNVKPFAPASVAGARDGSNNLTVTWDRVSRANARIFQRAPRMEPVEEWEVDVYDLTWTTVLRTIYVSSDSAAYTAAQQTTDGLTPGNNVNVAIYQIGDLVGRGFETRATV